VSIDKRPQMIAILLAHLNGPQPIVRRQSHARANAYRALIERYLIRERARHSYLTKAGSREARRIASDRRL
jgi:hypothetical protein